MRTPAKVGLLTSLYLSQGLPYGFFTQAVPAMLAAQGASLPDIGLASLLTLPWALKFLWAPWVDRVYWPSVGRRRSWILPLQAATALVCAALAGLGGDLRVLMGVFVLISALSATQDIATDGLAVSLLREHERGLGNGVQVAGYRVGMVLGGGALLWVFARVGFGATFAAMGALLLLASVPIALHREAPAPARPPGERARLGAFLARPGLGTWLLLVALYKAPDALGGAMLKPMLVQGGLGLEDLAWVTGTVGSGAGLVGALLGGLVVNPLGRQRALVVLGLAQAAAVGAYALLPGLLATGSPLVPALVGLEHLLGGMATVALFTRMMDACRPGHEGADYTVQASAVVVATGLAAVLSGVVAERVGYTAHFALSGALTVLPALGFAGYGRWEQARRAAAG